MIGMGLRDNTAILSANMSPKTILLTILPYVCPLSLLIITLSSTQLQIIINIETALSLLSFGLGLVLSFFGLGWSRLLSVSTSRRLIPTSLLDIDFWLVVFFGYSSTTVW